VTVYIRLLHIHVIADMEFSLAQKMRRAIADVCIEHDVDVLLGPGGNVKRTLFKTF